MRKTALVLCTVTLLGAGACTSMTPTAQGALSGAALGGAAGAGITALSGGSWATGAAIGGAIGGAAGAYKGCRDEGRCR